MENRLLAQDARDKVIELLTDSTTGFNALIGTINSERSHNSPSASSIVYNWGRNQFPFLLVDIDTSEVIYDDDTTPLSLKYEILPEVYTLYVMGFLKYTNDDIYNYAEDWIEAIIRVLHNYNSSGVTWIAYTNTERADIYKNENETLKSFIVSFEFRVN